MSGSEVFWGQSPGPCVVPAAVDLVQLVVFSALLEFQDPPKQGVPPIHLWSWFLWTGLQSPPSLGPPQTHNRVWVLSSLLSQCSPSQGLVQDPVWRGSQQVQY